MENKDLQLISENNDTLSLMNKGGLEGLWRVSEALSRSDIIPKAYQGKAANCLIALEMARDLGISSLAVMQNLDVIQGKPSWSSQFIISRINASGRYSPLKWKIERTKENLKGTEYVEYTWQNKQRVAQKKKYEYDLLNVKFIAYATSLDTGEIEESIEIDYKMAIQEGWLQKEGSKWQTMPELMGRYRSAAFFGRLNCPDILNGLQSSEEIRDVEYTVMTPEDISNEEIDKNANSEDIELQPESVNTETGEVKEEEKHEQQPDGKKNGRAF